MCDDTLLSHTQNDNDPKVREHDQGVLPQHYTR